MVIGLNRVVLGCLWLRSVMFGRVVICVLVNWLRLTKSMRFLLRWVSRRVIGRMMVDVVVACVVAEFDCGTGESGVGGTVL